MSRPWLAVLALALALGAVFAALGPERAWRLWSVPTLAPHFADLRPITHGAVTHARGLDPMVENPADPWQRTLNYPRIWQGLYVLGVGPQHTTALGWALLLAFAASATLVVPRSDPVGAAVVLAGLASPATMLAVERANTDLLMAALVTVGATLAVRHRRAAAVVFGGAFALKLYPLAAVAALVARRWRRRAVVAGGVLVLAYLMVSAGDLARIRAGTPTGWAYSYGLDPVWMAAPESRADAVHWIARAVVLVVGLAAAWRLVAGPAPASVRQAETDDPAGAARSLSLFRAGAAVYVGTFLLGANWDYRLLFLVLTLPQLVAWCRDAEMRALAGPTLGMVALALGSLWLVPPDAAAPAAGFWVGQGAKWTAFAGLALLLASSCPAWIAHGLCEAGRRVPGRPSPALPLAHREFIPPGAGRF